MRAALPFILVLSGLLSLFSTGTLKAEEDDKKIEVRDLSLQGSIEGENVSLKLKFKVETKRSDQEIPLIGGSLALQQWKSPEKGVKLRYETPAAEAGQPVKEVENLRIYYLQIEKSGILEVEADFAARSRPVADGWREAVFSTPVAPKRQVEALSDREDLEVQFPEAMRITREVKEGKLTVSAVLGAGAPFTMRWKPRVAELDAKRVMTADASLIGLVGSGVFKLDALFAFDISQGKLQELQFNLAKNTSIVQVRGAAIRDWKVEKTGDTEQLTVSLNRPQTGKYQLQVQAEMPLGTFPMTLEWPEVTPQDCMRVGGTLALGTDSAIQLLPKETAGLSQMDAAAFPVVTLEAKARRELPKSKSFFYSFSAMPLHLKADLSEITPSYDASEQVVATLREEDFSVDLNLDLDVREAPLRRLMLEVPTALSVVSLTGQEVEDYNVQEARDKETRQRIEVHFKQPVLGRTSMACRLELGRSPLNTPLSLADFAVCGAKNERGSIQVVADESVLLEDPTTEKVREIHVGSLPSPVPNARFAYRFRESGWSLSLQGKKKPAGLKAEWFLLLSLSDGLVQGNALVTYYVTGAPVDELSFVTPPELQNLEFVGKEVQRWSSDKGRTVVKLRRKVFGDFSLAASFTQRYKPGEVVPLGGFCCDQLENQSGFLTLTSRQNLKLIPTSTKPDKALLDLQINEIPEAYRAMIVAPILKSYKVIETPYPLSLNIETFRAGTLLASVVDLTEMETNLSVREDRETETVTKIRYKVKNTSEQYMRLVLPEGAALWNTRLIERDAEGQEKASPLVSSYDKESRLLLMPLKRNLNPNDPTTLEIEYAQTHGRLGWFSPLHLLAPRCESSATFCAWKVNMPKGWRVTTAEGGSLAPEETSPGQSKYEILSALLKGWSGLLFSNAFAFLSFGLFIGAVLGLTLGLIYLFRRAWLKGTLRLVGLLALLFAGFLARMETPNGLISPTAAKEGESLVFTQALNLEDERPTEIALRIQAPWLGGFSGGDFAAILLGCGTVALFFWRRKKVQSSRMVLARRLLTVLGIAFIAAGFLALPWVQRICLEIFTWGIPILLMGWICGRALYGWFKKPSLPAAASLLLLAMLLPLQGGCSLFGAREGLLNPKVGGAMFENVSCRMTLEKGTAEITLNLQAHVPQPSHFPLFPRTAALLSPVTISDQVDLQEDGQQYVLRFKKAGDYNLHLQFLHPVTRGADENSGSLTLPLPAALSNETTLILPDPNLEVQAPEAVRLTQTVEDGKTVARAVWLPGASLSFSWKPRARRTDLEKIAFFANVFSLARFDAGLVEGRHLAKFQVAQGELREIHLKAPEKATVTAVQGDNIGAWRFDPVQRELEVRLNQPATGEYCLGVLTQTTCEGANYKTEIGSLQILNAQRQQTQMGLMAFSSVTLSPMTEGAPEAVNLEDFARDAWQLLNPLGTTEPLRAAYRLEDPAKTVTVEVQEVKSEIRLTENSTLTVQEDRLLLASALSLDITKAGIFSAELRLPEGFEVDALNAAEISHWDEVVREGSHWLLIHFRQKTQAVVQVRLMLSCALPELPKELPAPRLEAPQAIKHSGLFRVLPDRGIRLSVASRKGVGDQPLEDAKSRDQGALEFKILRPDWEMTFALETLEPRLTAEFMHLVQVGEGVLRHAVHFRYDLYNAGVKSFEVQLPKEATGVVMQGKDINQYKEASPASGLYRVELANKCFDRSYQLQVRYETRFDGAQPTVSVVPVQALGADPQRGYLAIISTEKIEVTPGEAAQRLQAADARRVPALGVKDLSDAAFCFRCPGADYGLTLQLKRHTADDLLRADVQETNLMTVVNDRGAMATRVQMSLKVDGRRYLEMRLPLEAELWTLQVNGRSMAPSQKATEGVPSLLIPLDTSAVGELPVCLDFIYVQKKNTAWHSAEAELEGPRFDLPLKKIRWKIFLPPGIECKNFGGTMTKVYELDEVQPFQEETLIPGFKLSDVLSNSDIRRSSTPQVLGELQVQQAKVPQQKIRSKSTGKDASWNYSNTYDQATETATQKKLEYAREYQRQAQFLSNEGRNLEAQSAFDFATNFSQGDTGFNADNRIQQFRLSQNSGMAGLVERRAVLRPHLNAPLSKGASSQKETEKILSSLNKEDNENLEQLTGYFLDRQELAGGETTPLVINLSGRGRMIEFERPHQVTPNAAMRVSFSKQDRTGGPKLSTLSLGLILFVLSGVCLLLIRRWPRATAHAVLRKMG